MCLLIRQQSLLRCHAVQDGDDDEDGASRRRRNALRDAGEPKCLARTTDGLMDGRR